jgi:type II secretory pathway component GspD/PulD (secretin)
LGGGGGGAAAGGAATGTVIIPDLRLNALLVHATARELDTMEQLLKVIDQPSSPEDVQTAARPRLIPLINTKADEVAAVLRQVYTGRLQADGSQPRQPSPEEFIRALRGGRGGSQQSQRKTEEQKVTIGVDTRTNSLVVSAPEYLFNEIKELVDRLDTAVTQADEAVRVVTLKNSNPAVIQRTITAVLGDQVKTSTPANGGATSAAGGARPSATSSGRSTGSSGRGSSSSGRGGTSGGNDPSGQLRQQLELFQQLQRFAPPGGGGGGAPGGGFPGGGGRGR